MNKDKLEKLREKYKAFKHNNIDPFELKKELTEAMEKEVDRAIVEELADMLLDIYLAIDEGKCHCRTVPCSCSCKSLQDDLLSEEERGKRKRYTGKYKSSRRGKG